ncbi:MAG: 5'-3' exonuclease H3TH domain-containing protein [Lachnospiraceae bacterium]
MGSTHCKPVFIDASALLVTSYYGNLPKSILFEKDPEKKKEHYDEILHTKDGQYTNAVIPMVSVILKILETQHPSHLLFAFDRTRDTFRRKKFEAYKAQRAETPDPLKQQFASMETLLQTAGFVTLSSDTYEADDIVGSAVEVVQKALAKDGACPTCYIWTKDHDYLQLCSDTCRIWLAQTSQDKADALNLAHYGCASRDMNLPDKTFLVTPGVCREEYGVAPSQIPDLKGIQGDPSDNIPGVKGVSSAAIPLLNEYGTLEEIYAALDDAADKAGEAALKTFWKEDLGITRSPAKALRENREIAFLSRDLATIRKEAPLGLTEEALRIEVNRDLGEKLKKAMAPLELKKLAKRVDEWEKTLPA